ncbi:MAG: hypothetical protein FVQ79_02245 [Planctomycetes bacterium]|nr:hypothetical protein [Planctomycetota bacterium]
MMAVIDQPKTTYSDTTTHKRAIGDVMNMIDPRDTPLVAILGLDSARTKFKIFENSTKIELLEDELDPLSTTANQGTTITTTTLSITVTDGSVFQDGHVIKLDSEYMVVSAVSSEVITVESRSYGGTNATHVAGVTIDIVGMARLEGDDTDYGPIVDITAPYNYTSIFQKGIKITGTQEKMSQYGIDNEFAYQADKQIPHLLRLVERMFFYGIRAVGTATTRRSAGGLGVYITDNTVAAGGTITKADVDGLAEKVYMDGGNPNILVVHPGVANDLRGLIDTSSFVRVGQENTVLGMMDLKTLNTQYGPLGLVMDRHAPVAFAWMLDTTKVGVYTYRPFTWKRLGLTGDNLKGEVVGEFSLLVANDKAHGKVQTITS